MYGSQMTLAAEWAVRLARVSVSEAFLRAVLVSGREVHYRVEKGIPPDARLVAIVYVPEKLGAYAIFDHESFQDVGPDEDTPTINVELTKLYCEMAERPGRIEI